MKRGYTLISEIILALQNRRRVSLVARDKLTPIAYLLKAIAIHGRVGISHIFAGKRVKTSSFVVTYVNTV